MQFVKIKSIEKSEIASVVDIQVEPQKQFIANGIVVHNCSFCCWSRLYWNNKIRYRSVKNVVDEYDYLYKTYGECEVLDDADCFDTRYGVELAMALLNKGLGNEKVLWNIQTHPNYINDLESMKLMKDSGLTVVKLGIESLNQATLDRIRKQSTVKSIARAIDICKQAKVMVHANLMVGFPFEDRDDAMNTIYQIKELNPNQAQFSLLIPYPFTDIYDESLANNYFIQDAKTWSNFNARKPMLSMEGLSGEEVSELYKQYWREFYLNWKYILKHVSTVRHWKGLKQLYSGYRSVKHGHMRSVE